MAITYHVTGNVTIHVHLNGNTGLCDTIVMDQRADSTFHRHLPLDDYNGMVDFIMKADENPYIIDMLKEKYRHIGHVA